MALRIRIDRERCMGTGNCLVYAPEVFDLDDEGKACVQTPDPPSREALDNAVRGCPMSAISVEEGP